MPQSLTRQELRILELQPYATPVALIGPIGTKFPSPRHKNFTCLACVIALSWACHRLREPTMRPARTDRIAAPLLSASFCLCLFVISPGLRDATELILKIAYLYVVTGFDG